MDFEDIFDNLDNELGNLKIRLSKNVYDTDNIEILSTFLDDFSNLCKVKKFDVELPEVEQLTSYTILLQNTKSESQEYVSDSIRRFYTEFIESLKDEIYL
ncbi:hypothetical protein ACTGUZ_04040 [Streptococcus suis]|nr:hypothetical protein [Streptococcus suis]NQQ56104.1 hypothetical protein [Streptococcus suis]HEM5583115.1 hypothetical protein [Streptococcus suis]HEP1826843.1 hypothetical protein [Streptococcus suis]HEP1842469.1 hypothetical protein [Streptococcus suis]